MYVCREDDEAVQSHGLIDHPEVCKDLEAVNSVARVSPYLPTYLPTYFHHPSIPHIPPMYVCM